MHLIKKNRAIHPRSPKTSHHGQDGAGVDLFFLFFKKVKLRTLKRRIMNLIINNVNNRNTQGQKVGKDKNLKKTLKNIHITNPRCLWQWIHPLPLKKYYNLKYKYNCSCPFQRKFFFPMSHSVIALSVFWRLRVLEQSSSNIRLVTGEFIDLGTLVWGIGFNFVTTAPEDGANCG